jgi:hypothetical protein
MFRSRTGIATLGVLLCLLVLLAGCGKKTEPQPASQNPAAGQMQGQTGPAAGQTLRSQKKGD